MRMRYERRDPRPEDLRQIDELKSIIDSQEKDIFQITEQLRDLQLQQQQQMPNHQSQPILLNANQSKRNKGKNNKTITNNRNNINSNGNSNINNNTQQQQPQMRHQNASEPQQIQQNANHERDQQQPPTRMKPPPLIKTIIYEDENEDELYEQQIREERENARIDYERATQSEMQHQQDGVMVELVPESPDYATKHMNLEEISEAHIVSDQDLMNNIPDVVLVPTTSPDDKLQEIRVEVISTIEPANIQVVYNDCNGNDTLDLELD